MCRALSYRITKKIFYFQKPKTDTTNSIFLSLCAPVSIAKMPTLERSCESTECKAGSIKTHTTRKKIVSKCGFGKSIKYSPSRKKKAW